MTSKKAIIDGKKYSVEHVFNMVGNWYFTDENGTTYLVDSEDVQVWNDEQGKEWDGINTAIDYAKYLADESEDGVFWWKVKE